jgi:hypothetical protein
MEKSLTWQTTYVKVRSSIEATARVIAANPNAVTFLVGLTVLAASIAQWSGPMAGVVVGGTLMLVAVWPFVARARGEK